MVKPARYFEGTTFQEEFDSKLATLNPDDIMQIIIIPATKAMKSKEELNGTK